MAFYIGLSRLVRQMYGLILMDIRSRFTKPLYDQNNVTLG